MAGRARLGRAPALVAVLLAVLLAVLVPAVVAQVPGERCGPLVGLIRYKWMRASALYATDGMGAAPAVDGCATSDRGTSALVMAQLPMGNYFISGVSMKASGPANRNLAIWGGNANVTAYVRQLRSGSNVMEHFTRCQQRRNFDPRDRRHTLNCNPEVMVTGMFVVFMAEALTVCDVLVCASQMEFAADGTPMTPEAAARMQLAGGNGTSSGLEKAIETCTGFESQKWRTCPPGLECVSTYQPGWWCGCGECSAFSEKARCNQGDTTIGAWDCCFTCPPQNVCAVCVKPCNPVFDRIEATPGVLPRNAESITPLAATITSKTQAVNRGNNAQTISVVFAIQQQLTTTMTYSEALAFSEKLSIKVGVPFIGETGIEFGATQTFTTTKTYTDQRTTTVTTTLSQQIPPLTMQDVTAMATTNIILVKVPITVTTYYTCDKVEKKDLFAILSTTGTVAAVSSSLRIEYGEQYPIDPPYVYPQANATCVSNPVCSELGLREGNCCPDSSGAFKSCCSFCVAKPACVEYAITNTTMCCPARTARENPCCKK